MSRLLPKSTILSPIVLVSIEFIIGNSSIEASLLNECYLLFFLIRSFRIDFKFMLGLSSTIF